MDEFDLQSDKTIWELGFDFERMARGRGYRLIAGVDEVGRGCIAGPVVAAACILDEALPIPADLDDSKKLDPATRQQVACELRSSSVAIAISEIAADEIDKINILEATKKAMLAAVEALSPAADYLLIDALRLKTCPLPQTAIIKGDSISYSIAAASVLAKTYRDELMRRFDEQYPGYGFADHKGYGCRTHYEAIRKQGPCPIHRKTFRGVAENPADQGTLFA